MDFYSLAWNDNIQLRTKMMDDLSSNFMQMLKKKNTEASAEYMETQSTATMDVTRVSPNTSPGTICLGQTRTCQEALYYHVSIGHLYHFTFRATVSAKNTSNSK